MFLTFGVQTVLRVALTLICCSDPVEDGLQNVANLNDSGFEFATAASFELEQQSVPAVVGFFDQAGGTITSVVADEGVVDVLTDIAFFALEIFLD